MAEPSGSAPAVGLGAAEARAPQAAPEAAERVESQEPTPTAGPEAAERAEPQERAPASKARE